MARKKNDGRGRMGGRQKGTPNKLTSTVKSIIQDRWQWYADSGTFEEDLHELDPATRASLMEKYAQYIAPKMKSTEVDINLEGGVTIEDALRELSGDDDGE